eukprot:5337080-Amphidinium_carterae.1
MVPAPPVSPDGAASDGVVSPAPPGAGSVTGLLSSSGQVARPHFVCKKKKTACGFANRGRAART